MAHQKINTKKVTQEYIHSVRGKLHVEKAMIFGSMARKEATHDSDIDLIILSNDFAPMSLLQRLSLLNGLRRGDALKIPMDILGYTQKEFLDFKKSDSSSVRGIYRDARQVYPKART